MAVPKYISSIESDRKRRQYVEWWKQPWEVPTNPLRAVGFKKLLRQHGRLSPHFTIEEWRSNADRCGCPHNIAYVGRCQKTAFLAERVRHDIGDVGFSNHSAFRNTCHEGCIGGAFGEHPRGRAIDPARPSSVSVSRWNAAWLRHFGHGGIGRGCSSGIVQHGDWGSQRRWCYSGR